MTGILIGFAAVAVYIGACWLRPFAACMRCRGEGKARSLLTRRVRRCRACRGTGRRVRAGRRLWTWWTATWAQGAK